MRTTEQFVIEARPGTVWQVLADVEHWHDWTPTIQRIEPLDAGGLRSGARYRVVQPGLQPAVYEVTVCIPDQVFTWVYRLPGGEMVADHRIATRNGQTEVEFSFSSKGLMADVLSMLFSKKIREFVATEAISLKRKCESILES
ncbi:MAG TPA: SRPBCC family protein [Terracidiphilus sp.]|jgi:Polyketide cyclase / dehydrase and lipid transport